MAHSKCCTVGRIGYRETQWHNNVSSITLCLNVSGDLPSWSEHRFLGSNGELDTVEEEDKEARGYPALLLRTNAGRLQGYGRLT